MGTGLKRARRMVLSFVAVLAVAAAPLTVTATAQAAPVVGFKPGNIISDSLFYNGTAMTASEVQTFLNQRVPRCTIGDPGRTAGMAWGTTRIANKCLRDFSMNTTTKLANANCATYAGRNGETAAQIITRVAQACGISQRVLLITLEKEQSLVSDTWPTVLQFDRAMGYACPDSGPGNSANCDATYAGFFNQVYLSAWQLKNYRLYASTFKYKAFQNNTIQWHPNAGCGTSQVYIENWATAALYIYTPYRPNQAALNAGWGTGDSCSSYGNRNFYNFYITWFGNTQANYSVTGAIQTYWQANQAWLGQPVANAVSRTQNGGGRTQVFSGGTVFEPASGQVSAMTTTSPILAAYNREGFVAGKWGWPVAAAVNLGSSGNNSMQFQSGLVIESKDVGSAYLIPTALVANWQGSGGLGGSLGAPKSEATSSGGVLVQSYQKNTIIRDSGGTITVFASQFVDFWLRSGGGSGPYGLPTGGMTSVSAGGGGHVYPLSGATLYSSSAGVFALPPGQIATAYAAASGPQGAWGWPRGRQLCAADGSSCSMDFTGGVATWSSARGTVFSPLQTPSQDVAPGAGEKVLGEVAR